MAKFKYLLTSEEINLTLCCSPKHICLSQRDKLKIVECYDNRVLESLDLSNCNNLNSLYIKNTHISKINLSGCVNLKTLLVEGGMLKELDLSDCPFLTEKNIRIDNHTSVIYHIRSLFNYH